MSPASYQTAPPRAAMLPGPGGSTGGASPLGRGRRRGRGLPGLQRRRLLDQHLRGVDLPLVAGQVAQLQERLGGLEVLEGLLEERSHVAGRGRLGAPTRWRRLL